MLYGDGIHDDSAGIQALIDAGSALVELPMPKVCYLISKPILIRSYLQLRLPRYASVRLADGSDCHMIENGDPDTLCHDFTIEGGIWDANNLGQAKNPIHFPHPTKPEYTGNTFFLTNIRDFRIANLTMKDPTNFAITLDRASYFTVEDIRFDFNFGNPWAVNMDGVHVDGNCHYGVIRNLRGTCYDDLVAFNADEGSGGPISHMEVDGIFCEDCHSAARLLSVQYPVSHIHIQNVHGSFYQYCIGVTKYYEGESEGGYDGLCFDHLHIEKAKRLPVHQKEGMRHYPLIWFEDNLTIGNVAVRDVVRREKVMSIPLVKVEKTTKIGHLILSNLSQVDLRGEDHPMIENLGTVDALVIEDCCNQNGALLQDEGSIGTLKQR